MAYTLLLKDFFTDKELGTHGTFVSEKDANDYAIVAIRDERFAFAYEYLAIEMYSRSDLPHLLLSEYIALARKITSQVE